MKKEEFGPLGAWALGLLLFIATLIIIRWTVDFVTWSAIDSGWAQAIGAIAAIAASFGFFYSQKRAEIIRGEAESILTHAKALIGVHMLCNWSIDAMEIAFEQMECQHSAGVIPFVPERFDELRQLFGQFVAPSSNLFMLSTALQFSNWLMEAKHDFPAARDDGLREYVLDRSRERIENAQTLTESLKGVRDEYLDACKAYDVNPVAGALKPTPASASSGI